MLVVWRRLRGVKVGRAGGVGDEVVELLLVIPEKERRRKRTLLLLPRQHHHRRNKRGSMSKANLPLKTQRRAGAPCVDNTRVPEADGSVSRSC